MHPPARSTWRDTNDRAKEPGTPGLAALPLVLSGAAGLAYEVLWAREWALWYGATAIGTAVVLVAFMSGLAAGAWSAGRLPAARDPVRRYVAIELAIVVAIAGYLMLHPLLPHAAAAIHAVPAGMRPAAQVTLAVAVLLVPTALMGATLPVYTVLVGARDAASAGRLYAWNTLGGAAGALATAVLGVRFLGVRGTFLAAMALNLVAAVVATAVPRARAVDTPEAPRVDAPSRGPAAAVAAAMAGFVGLAAQVVWTRGLAGVLSNSVYSVALVLTGVLAGIVAGAATGARIARARAGASPSLALAAGAVALVGSLVVLRAIDVVSLRLIAMLGVGSATTGLAIELGLALLVVLVPSTVVGAAFPLVLRMAAGVDPTRMLGSVLAANTIGGVAGALAAAFVLLPRLGIAGSLSLLAALAALTALVIAPARSARVGAGGAALVAVLAAVLVPPFGVPWRRPPGQQELFYRDGAAATVSVTRDPDGGKRLRVNGQYSLGGAIGLFLERREAHLPLLLHPAPARLLHVGVGTGDTIGAALTHPGLRVDGLELVPEVIDAAELFASENRGALASPRVRVIVDDARSRLLASDDDYDVILADLFLPWTAGAAHLYAREVYALGARRLRPGGLYCQWLPLHQLGPADLATIVATFASVFPETQLWLAYHRAMTPLAALMGSAGPIAWDADSWRRRLADPTLARALASVGLDDPLDVAALYVAGGTTLRAATRDVPLVTDDRPRLEFSAAAAYFRQEHLARESLAWIGTRLDPEPGDGLPDVPVAVRRGLLRGQTSLLAGDRPGELRAYLDTLSIAPRVRIVRSVLVAIANERLAAGDTATAVVVADALRAHAPDAAETAALAGRIARH